MDRELKKIYLYVGVFVAVLLIGVTYAFFTAGLSSEDTTTVRADAGTMKIKYDGGASINLSGIYPRDEVWATKNITVTGDNTTDAKMYYKLTLVVDSNTFKDDDPLVYELVSVNTSANGEVVPSINKTNISSSKIELGSAYFVKANSAIHTYQLKIYYPVTSENQNDNQGAGFNAHVEIEDVKEPKVMTFADTILADNEVKTPLSVPGVEVSGYREEDVTATSKLTISSQSSYYVTYGTGWKANGTGFNLTGAAVTSDTYANTYSSLVGKYLASTYYLGSTTAGKMLVTNNLREVYYVVDATAGSITYKKIGSNKKIVESVLASAEDDYGTSYYFRGAVNNNYVEFANKCWRIVRINGDRSVKLVLFNDNTGGVANPCSSVNNSTTAAFAHFNGTKYAGLFNYDRSDNAYIGFMYGLNYADNYAETHANENKSVILTNLETWYKNNLDSYDDNIADTIWCNDKSVVTDSSYNPSDYTLGTDYGIKENGNYYSTTQRIMYSNNAETGEVINGTGPSLVCPNDNDGGKLSKFTVSDVANGNGALTYKIGLLTADEVALAGYSTLSSNPIAYLQENTSGYWWTLSPEDFDSRTIHLWAVNATTGNFYGAIDSNLGVRPAISLVSSTQVTGSGTSEDPYKII